MPLLCALGIALSSEAARRRGWGLRCKTWGAGGPLFVRPRLTSVLGKCSIRRTLRAREGTPRPDSRAWVGEGLYSLSAFSLKISVAASPSLSFPTYKTEFITATPRSMGGVPCAVFLQIRKPVIDQIQLQDVNLQRLPFRVFVYLRLPLKMAQDHSPWSAGVCVI